MKTASTQVKVKIDTSAALEKLLPLGVICFRVFSLNLVSLLSSTETKVHPIQFQA